MGKGGLDQSKLKAFADEKRSGGQKLNFSLGIVKNILSIKKMLYYQIFFFFCHNVF